MCKDVSNKAATVRPTMRGDNDRPVCHARQTEGTAHEEDNTALACGVVTIKIGRVDANDAALAEDAAPTSTMEHERERTGRARTNLPLHLFSWKEDSATVNVVLAT